jgi:myo-inositol-1(or 4)-monophosphatase
MNVAEPPLMDMQLLAAQAVAREAGAKARRRFLDRSFTVAFKGRQDYLTEVDGETEAFIAERLTRVFPKDGFIGEESNARPAGAGGAVWVVDPIDGTANFARGVPHFCVSIACVAEGKVEVGVIYNPMLEEMFAAIRGGGAWLNGERISASPVNALANAAIEVGWNSRAGFAQYVDLLKRVASTGASPSRTGSGALAIAYVAAGRLDGFVEHHINAWDCLAGILLVSEAGGYVSDFLKGDGLARGAPLIACAPGIKDALIAAAAFEGVAP